MLERWTDRARKVAELALREALHLGHSYIGTEHLLLALIREGEGVAAQVLVDDLHLSLAEVRTATIARLSGYASEGSKMRAFLREQGVEIRTSALTSDQLEAVAKTLGYAAGENQPMTKGPHDEK